MLAILADDKETLDDQVHVELEGLAVDLAPHDLYHFFGQFEIGSLESQVIGWRNVEYKSKIDVY